MAWSYDATLLNTTTTLGRLNTVRFLIGDTQTEDQLVQDEEISFALAQCNSNVYTSAAFLCRAIAAKFARMVDTELSGSLSVSYSDRSKQYQQLAVQVETIGKKYSGTSLGLSAGGLTIDGPAFTVHQFDNYAAGGTDV